MTHSPANQGTTVAHRDHGSHHHLRPMGPPPHPTPGTRHGRHRPPPGPRPPGRGPHRQGLAHPHRHRPPTPPGLLRRTRHPRHHHDTTITIEPHLPGTALSTLIDQGTLTHPQAQDTLTSVLTALSHTRAGAATRALPVLDEDRPLWEGHTTWGQTMAALVQRRTRRFAPSLRAALPDLDTLLDALTRRLHRIPDPPARIVHGDLCPPNILATPPGRAHRRPGLGLSHHRRRPTVGHRHRRRVLRHVRATRTRVRRRAAGPMGGGVGDRARARAGVPGRLRAGVRQRLFGAGSGRPLRLVRTHLPAPGGARRPGAVRGDDGGAGRGSTGPPPRGERAPWFAHRAHPPLHLRCARLFECEGRGGVAWSVVRCAPGVDRRLPCLCATRTLKRSRVAKTPQNDA